MKRIVLVLVFIVSLGCAKENNPPKDDFTSQYGVVMGMVPDC